MIKGVEIISHEEGTVTQIDLFKAYPGKRKGM